MSKECDRRTLPPTKPIPKRPLGKTGYGLFTLARHDRHDEAVEIVNRAIDLGVNYIDTSALYGNGASELNIGTVMRERRDKVFCGCGHFRCFAFWLRRRRRLYSGLRSRLQTIDK
jgi:hypothetical protein